jgi:hypothetical protein
MLTSLLRKTLFGTFSGYGRLTGNPAEIAMPDANAMSKGSDLKRALGAALVECWASLPQEIQREIFEAAVAGASPDVGDDAFREELALFLHENHPRTDHPDSTSTHRAASRV